MSEETRERAERALEALDRRVEKLEQVMSLWGRPVGAVEVIDPTPSSGEGEPEMPEAVRVAFHRLESDGALRTGHDLLSAVRRLVEERDRERGKRIHADQVIDDLNNQTRRLRREVERLRGEKRGLLRAIKQDLDDRDAEIRRLRRENERLRKDMDRIYDLTTEHPEGEHDNPEAAAALDDAVSEIQGIARPYVKDQPPEGGGGEPSEDAPDEGPCVCCGRPTGVHEDAAVQLHTGLWSCSPECWERAARMYEGDGDPEAAPPSEDAPEKITRNESTPEARRIWQDVDRAAERAPRKVRERLRSEDVPDLVSDDDLTVAYMAGVERGRELGPRQPTETPEGGVARIAAERRRQVEREGWTPEHDDTHGNGEMAQAALSYIEAHLSRLYDPEEPPEVESRLDWPWDEKWWKPKNAIRDLERAGALIAAELDRLLRARGVSIDYEPPTEAPEGKMPTTERQIIWKQINAAFHPQDDASLDDCVNAVAEVLRSTGRLRPAQPYPDADRGEPTPDKAPEGEDEKQIRKRYQDVVYECANIIERAMGLDRNLQVGEVPSMLREMIERHEVVPSYQPTEAPEGEAYHGPTCANCGTEIASLTHEVRRRGRRYCNRQCAEGDEAPEGEDLWGPEDHFELGQWLTANLGIEPTIGNVGVARKVRDFLRARIAKDSPKKDVEAPMIDPLEITDGAVAEVWHYVNDGMYGDEEDFARTRHALTEFVRHLRTRIERHYRPRRVTEEEIEACRGLSTDNVLRKLGLTLPGEEGR